MIYALQGQASETRDGFFVLQVGGVFYKIYAGERMLHGVRVGQEMKIFCSSYIRDESVPELYGFLDEVSLRFFELLISVSGVGRKTALKVLDGGTVEEISSAIAEKKTELFSRVPGIGKKTAERIVLELGEKMAVYGSKETVERMEADRDVMDALLRLGFPRDSISEALRKIGPEPKRLEDRVRQALKLLGK
ncbi:MAG: Holliday junction branch migration protein RuvA [Nanoarchaeota archaeon]|nr:Holliday junction branch migration protein RuvA [Nanoarchaeota archaeon]